MERSQEYEPLILDLQKSQSLQQPKRLVFMSLLIVASISLLAATTFAVLYFTKPPTPQPTPVPRTVPTATPVPETTPEAVIEPTPTPTPEPVPTATALPQATATIPPPVTETPADAATGFLTLYSSPDNAEVVINGKVLGRTPLRQYELPAGTYTVTFAHEGKVSEYTITITAGETAEYTHQFQGFASLRIRAIPSDSNIYINGEIADRRAPLEIDGLLAGTYTISARKPGYASAEKTVVLEKEGHQDVLITLRRLGVGIDNSDTSSSTPLPEHPSDRLQRSNEQ